MILNKSSKTYDFHRLQRNQVSQGSNKLHHHFHKRDCTPMLPEMHEFHIIYNEIHIKSHQKKFLTWQLLKHWL